jgi:hypothetical protein
MEPHQSGCCVPSHALRCTSCAITSGPRPCRTVFAFAMKVRMACSGFITSASLPQPCDGRCCRTPSLSRSPWFGFAKLASACNAINRATVCSSVAWVSSATYCAVHLIWSVPFVVCALLYEYARANKRACSISVAEGAPVDAGLKRFPPRSRLLLQAMREPFGYPMRYTRPHRMTRCWR